MRDVVNLVGLVFLLLAGGCGGPYGTGWGDATEIHKAAWRGDAETILKSKGHTERLRAMARFPARFPVLFDICKTPMDLAIDGDEAASVGALIEAGVDPNDQGSYLPLVRAIDQKKFDLAELLIKLGADPNARDERVGNSPLTRASGMDDARGVRFLLKHGADATRRGPDGSTPLHGARSKESVHALLEAGADVNAADQSGRTPAMRAALFGDVETLIRAGADVSRFDDRGFGAAHYAVLGGKFDAGALDAVLATGVPVDVRDERHGVTPLMAAAAEGTPDMVLRLLSRGADPTIRDVQGRTAIDYAHEKHGRDERWTKRIVDMLEDAVTKRRSTTLSPSDVPTTTSRF